MARYHSLAGLKDKYWLIFNGFRLSLVTNNFSHQLLPVTTVSKDLQDLLLASAVLDMRITALFPLACAIVGFVLSMLCLFAGSKKSFMEEYNIITVSSSFSQTRSSRI